MSRAFFGLLLCIGCGTVAEMEPDAGAAQTGDVGSAPAGMDASTIGTATKDLYQSGTRIKAKMLVTSDGAKSWNGWRDTLLGLDCNFLLASDGQMRCLPTAVSVGIGAYYLDASCINEVGYTSSTCGVPEFALVMTSSSGCIKYSMAIYRPTKHTGDVYSKASDGTCSKASLGTSTLFLNLGQEENPSKYVAAVEQLE